MSRLVFIILVLLGARIGLAENPPRVPLGDLRTLSGWTGLYWARYVAQRVSSQNESLNRD